MSPGSFEEAARALRGRTVAVHGSADWIVNVRAWLDPLGLESVEAHDLLAGERPLALLYEQGQRLPSAAPDGVESFAVGTSGLDDLIEAIHAGRVGPHLVAPEPGLEGRRIAIALLRLQGGEGLGVEIEGPVDLERKPLRRTQEMPSVIEALLESARRAGARQHVVDNLWFCATETLLNSLYHAPAGPDGQPLFPDVDRADAVELPEGDAIEVAYGADPDGGRFFLEIVDPYGSLPPDQVLDSLRRGRERGTWGQRKAQGMGMGLYLTYETATSLVLAIEPWRRTSILLQLAMTRRRKTWRQLPRSFHLFVHETAGDSN